MTDRHAAYIVVLDEDVREDQTADVLNALRMTKGVISVEPVTSDIDTQIGEARANQKWRSRIVDLLREEK
jgi:nitrate reductase NapAB chaperone NapD